MLPRVRPAVKETTTTETPTGPLPSKAYIADETLDAWLETAAAEEERRHEELLAHRLKCARPGCEELGVWFMSGCVRGDGTPIPDGTASCTGHMPASVSAGPDGFLCLSGFGWLPDGSTWDDPETGAPPGSPSDLLRRNGMEPAAATEGWS